MSCISYLRKKKGLTQQGLADCLRIDRTTVAKWESGKSFPKSKMLPAIAVVLDTSIEQLLAGLAGNQKGA